MTGGGAGETGSGEWLLAEVRVEQNGVELLEQVRDELGHLARQHGARVSERHRQTVDGLQVEFFTPSETVYGDWYGRYLGYAYRPTPPRRVACW